MRITNNDYLINFDDKKQNKGKIYYLWHLLKYSMIGKLQFIILLGVLLFSASCQRTMYPSDMYRVKDKDVFSSNDELLKPTPFIIQPGDELKVLVLSNQGEKLLDPLSAGIQGSSSASAPVTYVVDVEGMVELPLVGRILVAGKTTSQCESELKTIYTQSVVDPFVQISVVNKRAFFLTGSSSQTATVVPFLNTNTTLMDVIATAGGINDGKAYAVRLIRTDSLGQRIYNIDLSSFEYAKYSGILMQPNDIVYVAARHRTVRKVFEELSPYLTLVSTVLIIYNFTR
ncbi:MAG: hypothetical protein CVU11_09540 [Bacteroidetes bacterium HGW-Bacteroidetes-6]|jgi:polysaccharide export outer membrane protein|nr:MAG: hypothetical protein CVU11_09540 [Bacteroidetes bacterium HGW-Bacteroidetes-6]